MRKTSLTKILQFLLKMVQKYSRITTIKPYFLKLKISSNCKRENEVLGLILLIIYWKWENKHWLKLVNKKNIIPLAIGRQARSRVGGPKRPPVPLENLLLKSNFNIWYFKISNLNKRDVLVKKKMNLA